MTTLVVGASGATGRLLVEQLLNRGESVKIIVRAESNLPETLNDHEHLSIIRASVLDFSEAETEPTSLKQTLKMTQSR